MSECRVDCTPSLETIDVQSMLRLYLCLTWSGQLSSLENSKRTGLPEKFEAACTGHDALCCHILITVLPL